MQHRSGTLSTPLSASLAGLEDVSDVLEPVL